MFPEGYGFSTIGGFDSMLGKTLKKEGVFCEFKVPEHVVSLMKQLHLFRSKNNRVITITLRNSKFDQMRNSNIPEWIRFAEYLKGLGFEPIIIPDADQPFDEDGKSPKFSSIGLSAMYNQGVRLYLYQKAFVNFFVPNGPGSLCVYSKKVKYIFMKAWLEDSLITPSDVSGYDWVDPIALRPYWGNEFQMFNGDSDTFDNIKKHFDEFCSRINKKAENSSS